MKKIALISILISATSLALTAWNMYFYSHIEFPQQVNYIKVEPREEVQTKGYDGICDLAVVVCPDEKYNIRLQ